MMKKTILIRTLSVLAIGGIVLWGAKSLAGGGMHIEYKAVCRAILPANAVWNTALNETGDIALVTQTETSHNVWEPDAGVATFSSGYLSGACSFSCRAEYVRDAVDEECKLDVPPAVYHDTGAGTITVTDGSTTYTIMDKNLGATVAGTGKINDQDGCITSTNGTTCRSESIGDYYQWGNNYGFANSGTLPSTSSTKLDASGYGPTNRYNSGTFITAGSDWSSVKNHHLRGGSGDNQASGRDSGNERIERQGPCPVGYHVPSAGEWGGLITARWNAVGSGGISIDIILGLPYFSDSIPKTTQFMNDFRLPLAGYRMYSSASVYNQGDNGAYWSSSPDGTYARYLGLGTSYVYVYDNNDRGYGFSVRCFQNS